MDSLHLSCINSSKGKHDENRALQVLEGPNNEKAARIVLTNLFTKSVSVSSIEVPQVNFVSFQVSAEPFCASEQSSLSGQCGSKFSADFESPRNTCTVALVTSVLNFRLCHVSQLQHNAVKQLTLALLRRRSVYQSTNDHVLLKKLYEVADSGNEGLHGSIDSADVQLQRLDCEGASNGSIFTAVPTVKSMIPFSLHRGDDVDVDDLSWLDQKVSEPVGKIIMECGVKKVKLHAFLGEKLVRVSDLERTENSVRRKSTWSASSPGHRSTAESLPQRSNVTAGVPADKAQQKLDEVSGKGNSKNSEEFEIEILSHHLSSVTNPLLSKTEKKSGAQTVNEDGPEQLTAKAKTAFQEAEHIRILRHDSSKKNRPVSFHKSGSLATGDSSQNDKYSSEFVFDTQKQGEMNLESVWCNLAHPTRLKVLQEGSDHRVNLVTSIVPAVCCWIPAYVDLVRVADAVRINYSKHRYSILACSMAQALPDKGKLLVKVSKNLNMDFLLFLVVNSIIVVVRGFS